MNLLQCELLVQENNLDNQEEKVGTKEGSRETDEMELEDANKHYHDSRYQDQSRHHSAKDDLEESGIGFFDPVLNQKIPDRHAHQADETASDESDGDFTISSLEKRIGSKDCNEEDEQDDSLRQRGIKLHC
jgi:hypothetical protein